MRPVDMRLSFDRLAALAAEVCGQSPLSGHLFVFHFRRRDRLKILYWDRDGLALWYKRLEKGVFPVSRQDTDSLAVSPAELSLLLEGVDISSFRRLPRKPRFSLAKIP
jgi:transposase